MHLAASIMNQIRPKKPRLRLDAEAYQELCRQVLERDNWRCQECGVMSNLELHHIDFRSRGGDDSELNLITLCTVCHTHAHRGSISAGTAPIARPNRCVTNSATDL